MALLVVVARVRLAARDRMLKVLASSPAAAAPAAAAAARLLLPGPPAKDPVLSLDGFAAEGWRMGGDGFPSVRRSEGRPEEVEERRLLID